MRKFVCLCVLVLGCSALAVSSLYGEDASSSPSSPPNQLAVNSSGAASGDQGEFGLGVKVGLLGVGAEVAARVTHRSNVRAGFNVMGYSRNFSKDSVTYDGHLAFRTVEAHYDIFPWAGSFHVSPGMLAYIGDPISARALVPGGSSFTLGGQQYFSDPANPASAKGKIDFNQVAPMVTVGFGNLIHRDSKRFSVPVELGIAFQGSPKTTLNYAGNVCGSPGVNCRSVASDPTVQANVISEQGKINHSLSPIKVWPIISVGFGYKF
jgi:hypothetical protein